MKLVEDLLRLILLVTVVIDDARGNFQAQCFSRQGIEVVAPGSTRWDHVRSIWNAKVDKQPAAIVFPNSEAQAQQAIRCAKHQGLRIVPRNGGHGYEGYSVQDGVIVLDVNRMKDFEVDNSSLPACVSFGPGHLLGDLSLLMYHKANALLPAGLSPSVGVSGQILGGGIGMSARTYGFTCDLLVAINLIDYNGNVIHATKESHSDLLWTACGGGGGNLGVVSKFTVIAYPHEPIVTTALVQWQGYNHAIDIFDKMQRHVPSSDSRLNAQMQIGMGQVSLWLQWVGAKAGLEEQLETAGISQVPGYQADDMVEGSWINATLRWGAVTMDIDPSTIESLNMSGPNLRLQQNFSQDGGMMQGFSSLNKHPMSQEGMQSMIDAVAMQDSNPHVGCFVEHKFLGGAVATVAHNATAFFWRESIFESKWFYFWKHGGSLDASLSWLNTTYRVMQPYLGNGTYLNYVNPFMTKTSQWQATLYGENLDKFIDIKTKYDPENYFRNPLTVSPRKQQIKTQALGENKWITDEYLQLS